MMSTTRSAWYSSRQQPASSRFGQLVQTLRRLPVAYRIYLERRALLALNDHALKDLGLSRADAYNEASRPFWEIPRNR